MSVRLRKIPPLTLSFQNGTGRVSCKAQMIRGIGGQRCSLQFSQLIPRGENRETPSTSFLGGCYSSKLIRKKRKNKNGIMVTCSLPVNKIILKSGEFYQAANLMLESFLVRNGVSVSSSLCKQLSWMIVWCLSFLFARTCLLPIVRFVRLRIFMRSDTTWGTSFTRKVMTELLPAIYVVAGLFGVCRIWAPVELFTEGSVVVVSNLLEFLQKLLLGFGFAWVSAWIVSFLEERRSKRGEFRRAEDDFVWKFVAYSAAAYVNVKFWELFGFNTSKWLAASGISTLAVTYVLKDFLESCTASVFLTATRKLMVNDWLQFTVNSQFVSGNVEHADFGCVVIRGDDRERIYVPNMVLFKGVFRNLSQRTHWRIKLLIPVNIMDRRKLGVTIEAMRKYMNSHVKIEQKTLHRRCVLLDVAPETQSLMVQVSCFVKTTIFEEYLRIKESVMFDLFQIMEDHGVRFAYPSLKIHRFHDDAPFPSAASGFQQIQALPMLAAVQAGTGEEGLVSSTDAMELVQDLGDGLADYQDYPDQEDDEEETQGEEMAPGDEASSADTTADADAVEEWRPLADSAGEAGTASQEAADGSDNRDTPLSEWGGRQGSQAEGEAGHSGDSGTAAQSWADDTWATEEHTADSSNGAADGAAEEEGDRDASTSGSGVSDRELIASMLRAAADGSASAGPLQGSSAETGDPWQQGIPLEAVEGEELPLESSMEDCLDDSAVPGISESSTKLDMALDRLKLQDKVVASGS